MLALILGHAVNYIRKQSPFILFYFLQLYISIVYRNHFYPHRRSSTLHYTTVATRPQMLVTGITPIRKIGNFIISSQSFSTLSSIPHFCHIVVYPFSPYPLTLFDSFLTSHLFYCIPDTHVLLTLSFSLHFSHSVHLQFCILHPSSMPLLASN